jgi:hypothetical protein
MKNVSVLRVLSFNNAPPKKNLKGACKGEAKVPYIVPLWGATVPIERLHAFFH